MQIKVEVRKSEPVSEWPRALKDDDPDGFYVGVEAAYFPKPIVALCKRGKAVHALKTLSDYGNASGCNGRYRPLAPGEEIVLTQE